MNEFGLFGDVGPGEYRVWGYEKTTKYLFTYNYIPRNYEAILVGPSYGNEAMDTRKIANFSVYNLSMNGVKVSELRIAAENAISMGEMKFMILCLDPYLTWTGGVDEGFIGPKMYWSSLGSMFMLKYYLIKRRQQAQSTTDPFSKSHTGFVDYSHLPQDGTSEELVLRRIEEYRASDTPIYRMNIDEEAYFDLGELLSFTRAAGVQIFAYYYPKAKAAYDVVEDEYAVFKGRVDELLNDDDVVIDFNTSDFDDLRTDYDSFRDGYHLTPKGADVVLATLSHTINAFYGGGRRRN